MKSKTLKNFLAVSFGMVLRKNRERLGWSYDEVASKASMKASYLQSVENSNAILHISKAYYLHNAYKIDPTTPLFSLEGLINILALISLFENAANDAVEEHVRENTGQKKRVTIQSKNTHYALGLSQLYTSLQAIDYYGQLLRPFYVADVITEIDVDRLTEKIEGLGLFTEIEKFIISPSTYGYTWQKKLPRYYSDFFNDIPSLHMGMFQQIRKSVLRLPITISFWEVLKWHTQNKDDIEEIVIATNGYNIAECTDLLGEFFMLLFKGSLKKISIYINPEKTDKDNLGKTMMKLFNDFYNTHVPTTTQAQYDNYLKEINIINSTRIQNIVNDTQVLWMYITKFDSPVAFRGQVSEEITFTINEKYSHQFLEIQALTVKEIGENLLFLTIAP